ncbi:MAG: enoyl-CoA hydratase/isomerase family protein [Chloroflexi bacterium]|nr:enoyl-CoA hydratase/isomerase family protein [Chloroflexota bacterium]
MPIHYSQDENNIVTLTFDGAGSVKVINLEFLRELDAHVSRLTLDESLKGVILTSAKDTFVAGADIDMLYGATDAAQVFQVTQAFKATLRKLEMLGKPVVAALNGSALGGGFEIALACQHRIALNKPKAQFGFPEVTLGVLPAGGGITRMVRLFGLQTALPYMIEGTRLNVHEALDAGWIDEIVAMNGITTPDELMEHARAWIHANPRIEQPWDRDGYRIPGGDPRRPQVMSQILPIAPAMLRAKTHRNYPAPEAILSAAVEGAMVNFETATRIESRYFAQLVTSQTAKNMMTAFWYQLNAIKAGKSRPKSEKREAKDEKREARGERREARDEKREARGERREARGERREARDEKREARDEKREARGERQETRKLGVLGAGFMGHGIAYASTMAGIDVVMKDVSQERADAGKQKIAALLDERVARGKVSKEQKGNILARIHATENVIDLAGCDLIIEAVFEDRAVKASVIRETGNVIGASVIFGSNTSTLPITSLAAYSERPENFVGIHFFSPVHKMPLVEIIRGKQTSDAAIAKAFDYVLKIGKTPIVVNDSRGFYTSRVFGMYVGEGMALLAEGQHPRAIESAGIAAGMAVGPLAVSDEVNIALIWHIREQTRKDFAAEGKTLPSDPSDHVVDFMVNKVKRTGKLQGAGFYEYPSDAKKFLWRELQKYFPPSDTELPQTEMVDRLLFVQALETARCFQEGVLTSSADANIGSIFGWSFAPYSGGTLQYINAYGVEKFVARARELANKYGERFRPPELLVEKARKGETL